MGNYFSDTALTQAPPVKRAAYSDRVAWILAEISRLVYEPLPIETTVTSLVKEIKSAVENGDSENIVEALIKKGIQSSVDNNLLIEILRKADFDFLESFAVDGTEAMLVKLNPYEGFDGMLILAFRGTQPSIKDVVTDLRADLVSARGGGRVHRGFFEAYQKVETQIEHALEEHEGLSLYITGHSLGGALAMVATKYLGSDSTGATYTYGCPRVADDEFFRFVKIPVYRIVNCADGVPRLPFGYGLVVWLSVIRLIPINGTKRISEWIRRKFAGYAHYGNLVFLSAPSNIIDEQGIPFSKLVVKMSPNIFWCVRIVLWRIIKTKGKAMVDDHSMNEYSQKLLAYAKRRNKRNGT